MSGVWSAVGRMLVVLSVALLSHAGGALTGAPAIAQSTTTPKGDLGAPQAKQKQDPWKLDCGEAGGFSQTTCRMMQTVIIKETGSPLLTAVIEARPDASGLSLLLKVPHGVLLAPGMQLQLAGMDPVALKFRLSDETGVFAATMLSDKMLGAMKTGDTLKINVITSSGQKVGIPVTLEGFATAFDKFNATR